MFTNSVGQWSKASYFQTLSNVDSDTVCSEHLPTARAKLLTCSNLIPPSTSADEHAINETHHPSVCKNHSCLHSKHHMELYDEKPRSHNGDRKQKLSLEIWLPNTRLDSDDELVDRTVTSEVEHVEKNPKLIPLNENQHINTVKTIVNTVQPSIKSKSIVSTHIDQNKDYNIPTLKRQPTTISTDYDEETHTFKITEIQSSANNIAVNTESIPSNTSTKVTTKPTNSKPISLFLQKYSAMRRDNHLLTTNNSNPIRLPDINDKTSANHRTNPNTKLLARCPTSIRSSYSNLQPQLRVFTLTNQPYSSLTVPSAIFLTTLSNKKTNETCHSLQRSRTYSDISSTTKLPSHTSGPSFEKMPCLITKRISFTLRSKQ